MSYSEDFESGNEGSPIHGRGYSSSLGSPEKYSDVFETFESDANSMLILGNPIDYTANFEECDIPGASPVLDDDILGKFDSKMQYGFDENVDDDDQDIIDEEVEVFDEDDSLVSSDVSMGAVGSINLEDDFLTDDEGNIDKLITDIENRKQDEHGDLSIQELLLMQQEEEKKNLVRKTKSRTKKIKKKINSKHVMIAEQSNNINNKSDTSSTLINNSNSIVVNTELVVPITVAQKGNADSRKGSIPGKGKVGSRKSSKSIPPESLSSVDNNSGIVPTTNNIIGVNNNNNNPRTMTGNGSRGSHSNSRRSSPIRTSRDSRRTSVSSRHANRAVSPLIVEDLAPNVLNLAGSIVSQVTQYDAKHTNSILERELDNALKRVSLYAQENEKLRARLDHSAIKAEFELMKSVINQQDSQIEELKGNNKGLSNVNRAQERKLLAIQQKSINDSYLPGVGAGVIVPSQQPYNKFHRKNNPFLANASVISENSQVSHIKPILDPKDIQIQILVQRVRRSQIIIKETRTKNKEYYQLNKRNKKEIKNLNQKVETLTTALNELAMHYNNNIIQVNGGSSSIVGSNMQGNSMISAPLSVDNFTVNGNNSIFGDNSTAVGMTLSTVQDNVSATTTIHKLERQVKQLQMIIDRQRQTHMKQISVLRNALLHCQEGKTKIHDDYILQEKQIKHQVRSYLYCMWNNYCLDLYM